MIQSRIEETLASATESNRDRSGETAGQILGNCSDNVEGEQLAAASLVLGAVA
jgi:hypothetical protein